MTKAELYTIVQTASERPIYGASNNMCEHAEAHTGSVPCEICHETFTHIR